MSGSLDRLDWSTAGFWVLQDFDTSDPFGAYGYDWTNVPINFGARHGWTINSDGIPQFGAVQDTVGPVGNFVCLPGLATTSGNTNDRRMAQWVPGTFGAKITTVGPPTKATPVLGISGGVWTIDPNLAEVVVTTADGAAPTLGSFGLVTSGTNLAAQELLFVPVGGGSGSTLVPAVITFNLGSGGYSWTQVDPSDNSTLSTNGIATEINRSENVPDDGSAFVFLVSLGGAYYFFYPLAVCT